MRVWYVAAGLSVVVGLLGSLGVYSGPAWLGGDSATRAAAAGALAVTAENPRTPEVQIGVADSASLREGELLTQVSPEVPPVLPDPSAADRQREFQRVADMYVNMPPWKAAAAMSGLGLELSVELLRRMDETDGAAILSYLNPEQSADIVRLLLDADAGLGRDAQ